jgi:SAM-dependent methyltransferase
VEFTEPMLLKLESQRRSPSAVAKRELLLELLQPAPGDRILDIGCGSGTFCRELTPFVAPGGHVVGIDREPAAIAVATRLSALEDETLLGFSQADAHDLPFPDESFDAVVCISVLGFCEDPLQVLGQARRVLRSGGRLLAANADEDTRVYNGHDRALGRRIARTIADRGHDPWLGRRLAPLLTTAGFDVEREVALVDLERDYAPESAGYLHARLWREHLLRAGIGGDEYERWLADLAACAQDGSYCYSVVTYACLARRAS